MRAVSVIATLAVLLAGAAAMLLAAPAVACTPAPYPRDTIGAMRRDPSAAIVRVESLGAFDENGWQDVTLALEQRIAGDALPATFTTRHFPEFSYVGCASLGPKYAPGERHLLVGGNVYRIENGILSPNGWATANDLPGLSEPAAVAYVRLIAAFLVSGTPNDGPPRALPLPDPYLRSDPRGLSLDRMVRSYRAVLLATVEKATPTEDDFGSPMTLVRMRIEERWLSSIDPEASSVEFLQYGARSSGWLVAPPSDPLVSAGERYLLFYGERTGTEGPQETQGFALYRIVGDRVLPISTRWAHLGEGPDDVGATIVHELAGLTLAEARAAVKAAGS